MSSLIKPRFPEGRGEKEEGPFPSSAFVSTIFSFHSFSGLSVLFLVWEKKLLGSFGGISRGQQHSVIEIDLVGFLEREDIFSALRYDRFTGMYVWVEDSTF